MKSITRFAVRTSLVFVPVLGAISGCESREQKIQTATEAGTKGIIDAKTQSAAEVEKAKAHELEVTTAAANKVAEAQRVVEETKVHSVQTAVAADNRVVNEQLEGKERVNKATSDTQRQIEKSAQP